MVIDLAKNTMIRDTKIKIKITRAKLDLAEMMMMIIQGEASGIVLKRYMKTSWTSGESQ